MPIALTAPALSLSGHYVAIATLGLGEIVNLLLLNLIDLTRGPLGLRGIPGVELFGYQLQGPRDYYWLSLLGLAVTTGLAVLLARSHLGRTFRSIREDLLRGPVAPIAVLALRPGIDRLRHRFDYEQFGGSPLLGVRGVSIVTHGRAKARMMEHAIRVASEAAAAGIPELIAEWTRRHPAIATRDAVDTVDAVAGETISLARRSPEA